MYLFVHLKGPPLSKHCLLTLSQMDILETPLLDYGIYRNLPCDDWQVLFICFLYVN